MGLARGGSSLRSRNGPEKRAMAPSLTIVKCSTFRMPATCSGDTRLPTLEHLLLHRFRCYGRASRDDLGRAEQCSPRPLLAQDLGANTVVQTRNANKILVQYGLREFGWYHIVALLGQALALQLRVGTEPVPYSFTPHPAKSPSSQNSHRYRSSRGHSNLHLPYPHREPR